MKELPILYNTEMVIALLAGKKTMTRRTIKQKTGECMYCGCTVDNCKVCIDKTGEPCYWVNDEKTICSACNDLKNTNKSKYQKGDLLYVRETYCLGSNKPYHYAASVCNPKFDKPNSGWKPSIHMPKSAARIWLRVTGVKVERLQDITADDAIAEGIKKIEGLGYKHYTAKKRFTKEALKDGCPYLNSPILSFLTLWESIYGDESLKVNPWVFAYSFEVISTTGAPIKNS